MKKIFCCLFIIFFFSSQGFAQDAIKNDPKKENDPKHEEPKKPKIPVSLPAPAKKLPSTIFSPAFVPIPSGDYYKMSADIVKLKENSAAPAGDCEPGQLYNHKAKISICNDQNMWTPLTGLWTQVGNYIYPIDLDANIGIGTDQPSAKLEIKRAFDASDPKQYTDVDLMQGGPTEDIRWSLRAQSDGSFALGNIDSTHEFEDGALLIDAAGRVNIATDLKTLPAHSVGMLNVQSATNAIGVATPKQIIPSGLAATFSYVDPTGTGQSVGIGFGVGENAPNDADIHAAIVAERLDANSARLHLATRHAANNFPADLSIMEDGTVSINDPAVPAAKRGHLTITRQVGDTIASETTLTLIDADNTGTIGAIQFEGTGVTSSISSDANGHTRIDRNGKKSIFIDEDLSGNSTITVYKADGITEDGKMLVAPDSAIVYTGIINNDGTVDTTGGTGGFTSKRESAGKYTITLDSGATFGDGIPVVIVSSYFGNVIGTVTNLFGDHFTVEFYSFAGVSADTKFNFIASGPR